MDFSEYFTPTSVIPNLTCSNKLDAIQELVSVLKKHRRLPDADLATERVLEREALDTTGIGHGVAIPHARLATLNRIVCALGRHPAGLDFDSIDGEPVRLIFLILYPATEAARYLFLISALTRMLLHDGLADRLLNAPEDALLDAFMETAAAYDESPEKDQAEAPDSTVLPPASLNPVVASLIRLQRLEDQRPESGRSNPALEERIEHVRSCIPATLLKHYDRLRRRGGLAVVASEGGICQGCHMQFSTSFAQTTRSTASVAKCPQCSRFLYVI